MWGRTGGRVAVGHMHNDAGYGGDGNEAEGERACGGKTEGDEERGTRSGDGHRPPDQCVPNGRAKQIAQGAAGIVALGEGEESQAEHGDRPGTYRQQRVAAPAVAEPTELGRSHAEQRDQADQENPPGDQLERRADRRRGPGRRSGADRRRRHLDAEGKHAAGGMAVDLGVHPPADRVNALGQWPHGHRQR
jgi:hypothetical protein